MAVVVPGVLDQYGAEMPLAEEDGVLRGWTAGSGELAAVLIGIPTGIIQTPFVTG